MPGVNSVNGRDGNLKLPRDTPDIVTAETATTLSPTITLTQQSTSTIAGAQALFGPSRDIFSYTAAMDFGAVFPDTLLYQPVSRYPYTWPSPPYWSAQFGTDAATFEFMFKHVSNSATQYRMTIDGHKLADLMATTGATSVGSRHVLKFAFGSSAPRTIRIDFYTMPFGGVFIGGSDSIWKVPFTGDRLMILGDSFTAGSGENTGAGNGTWLTRFARLMGYQDIWNSSIGGTGYVADNSGASVTFGERAATDIGIYGPERVIVWGGYNDVLQPQADIDTAARDLYRTLTTFLDGYIVVVGPATSDGEATTGQLNTAATLRKVASIYKLPFIDPQTGAVYNEDGDLLAQTGAWITPENESAYIGGDGVHPNDAGHTYLAHRMAQAYRILGNP